MADRVCAAGGAGHWLPVAGLSGLVGVVALVARLPVRLRAAGRAVRAVEVDAVAACVFFGCVVVVEAVVADAMVGRVSAFDARDEVEGHRYISSMR